MLYDHIFGVCPQQRIGDFAFHEREYLHLTHLLEEAQTTTHLPEYTDSKEAFHDFLVRLRLGK